MKRRSHVYKAWGLSPWEQSQKNHSLSIGLLKAAPLMSSLKGLKAKNMLGTETCWVPFRPSNLGRQGPETRVVHEGLSRVRFSLLCLNLVPRCPMAFASPLFSSLKHQHSNPELKLAGKK